LARRFAPEVIAFFDGDAAGQQAAVRAFGVCSETGVWGLGAFLPQGFDPDTYVRQQGTSATLNLLQHAIPLADFFLQRMDPGPRATVPQRVRAAEQVAEVLARVEDAAQFSVLAKRAAEVLEVDEEVFRRRKKDRRNSQLLPPVAPPTEATSHRPEELALVEAMALDVNVAREAAPVIEDFDSRELITAAGRILEAWDKGLPIAALVDQLPAALTARLRATLLGDGPMASADLHQVARDCSARIVERHRRARVRELRSQVRQAEAKGDVGLLKALRDQLRQRRVAPS
jgi:DNA primase